MHVPLAAVAADALPGPLERAVVVAVRDDGLHLEDGRHLRLALLEPEAPGLPAAVAALLPPGTPVVLHWPQPQKDRHGRLLAHVVRAADGLWVQQAVVAAGQARVVTFADERAGAAALLAAEDTARRAGHGLWADPAVAPLRAADERAVEAAPAVRAGRLVLVEGTVASAAVVRGQLYLNFGADWRSDVTVGIAPAALRSLPVAWRDPAFWEGRQVRGRGWMRRWNGPFLDIDHAERLELLDSP